MSEKLEGFYIHLGLDPIEMTVAVGLSSPYDKHHWEEPLPYTHKFPVGGEYDLGTAMFEWLKTCGLPTSEATNVVQTVGVRMTEEITEAMEKRRSNEQRGD